MFWFLKIRHLVILTLTLFYGESQKLKGKKKYQNLQIIGKCSSNHRVMQ